MPEKYGIEVVKGAVKSALEAVSVLYAVFVEKKGIWALLGLQSSIKGLLALDLAQVRLELSDLSDAEREALEAEVKGGLPAPMQAGASKAIDIAERAIKLVEGGVDFVKRAIDDGKQLYLDVRALLGL